MHRFFIPAGQIINETACLEGGDAQHALRVLRLVQGSALLVCDGQGNEYDGEIISLDKDKVVISLKNMRPMESESRIKVTLYQGLPKQGKMETILQKCTELGAEKFVAVAFSRCVVRLDEKDGAARRQRWQKTAGEACKQSGRALIPEVAGPLSFEKSLEMMSRHDLLLVAYEGETERGLSAALKEIPLNIGIVIGPEGGLSYGEVEAMEKAGGVTVCLGKRILRTETAGMAVLSALMFAAGEMG
ncbi:MAG: 16S rRNA (uracil(1498)-N(3))-methyltransferase [Christensenellales bacterium]